MTKRLGRDALAAHTPARRLAGVPAVPAQGAIRIAVLDVGQGDATLLSGRTDAM